MRVLKYLGFATLFLVLVVIIYVMYVFSWSVKYSVGDCLKNGETVYLFDSDGPLLKGSYGLKLLLPKDRRSEYGIAYPRDRVESDSFEKVGCPSEELSEEGINSVKEIIE
jgi:hypothetical protein